MLPAPLPAAIGFPVAAATSLTVTSPQADPLAATELVAAGDDELGTPADGALWAGVAVAPLVQAATPAQSSADTPTAAAVRDRLVIMVVSWGAVMACGPRW
jgi:hypothetical protein